MRLKLKQLFTLILSLTLTLSVISMPVCASSQESFLQNWIVYEFNDANGLPTGEANTVIQTSDGYIWIGSYGGLIRYDGTEFYNFSGGSGGFPSGIRTLFEDSAGRLWIGTNDSGIYCYESDTFTHIEYNERTKFLSVRSIAEDREGRIYVGTTSGLAIVTAENQLLPIEGEEKTIYSMVCDKNSVIWACKDGGIVDFVKSDTVIGVMDSGKLLGANVYCAGVDNDGEVYLGSSENSIHKIDILNDFYNDKSFSVTDLSTNTVSTINDIAQDEKGNVWVAGINGVGFFDTDGKWNLIKKEHTVAAIKLCFDYEGNVWIASTSYGIIHLVEGTYYNVNENAQLSEIPLNTVSTYSDGYLIGTDTGLISLNKSFERVDTELSEMLEGERIRHIMSDSSGTVWISTYYNNGLVMYDPKTGKITAFTTDNGLTDNHVRMTLEMSDGSIAAATQNGINIIKDGNIVETYNDKNGLDFPMILCLCEGKDGALYAGSDGQGLYVIKDGTVTNYNYEQGLTSGVILRMIPDDDGKGLFISAGNSLFYWHYALDSIRKLDNYDKSPGSIFDMMLNGEDIWLMQSNGINIVNKTQLINGGKPVVKVIGATYGLTGSLNANTWNYEKDGIVYICTANGLSILNVNDLVEGNNNILPAINSVEIDGWNTSKTYVKMEGEATRLTFNFAALSFSGKEVSVRYMLDGFDALYSYSTSKNPLSASYTNLHGGNYTFKLEVLGSDGETVINSLNIPVVKNAPFWEMPIFWIVTVILFLLLISLIVAIVIRKKTEALKRRQSEYRTIIMQALRTFANTIDAKDKYTNGHSIRVAIYSNLLAKKLGLSADDQERLYDIALLHDIGKIGISDKILGKNGKLDSKEIEIIKQHPTIGGRILKDFTSIPGISDGARYHHERYDGTGYNEGLKGDAIPYFARIICVADCYDTMAGGRHYQHSKTSEEIREEFIRCSGTQFDPAIAQKMVELIDEGQVPVQFYGNEIFNFHGDEETPNITI